MPLLPSLAPLWSTGLALHHACFGVLDWPCTAQVQKPVLIEIEASKPYRDPSKSIRLSKLYPGQKISLFRRTDACFVKDLEFSIDFLGIWTCQPPGHRR